MKEASGELNMTVVTIILIGVVLGFFYLFWPTIQNSIQNQWDTSSNGSSASEKNRGMYNGLGQGTQN